jgi:hypothetical protein
MTVSLNHVQLNVSDRVRSLPFYRDFFGYFGYRTMADVDPDRLKLEIVHRPGLGRDRKA